MKLRDLFIGKKTKTLCEEIDKQIKGTDDLIANCTRDLEEAKKHVYNPNYEKNVLDLIRAFEELDGCEEA